MGHTQNDAICFSKTKTERQILKYPVTSFFTFILIFEEPHRLDDIMQI